MGHRHGCKSEDVACNHAEKYIISLYEKYNIMHVSAHQLIFWAFETINIILTKYAIFMQQNNIPILEQKLVAFKIYRVQVF